MKKASAVNLYIIFFFCLVLVLACSNNRTGVSEPQSRQSPSSSRSQIEYPLVLRTQDIIQFEQLQGQPEWIEAEKARVQGAVWTFNSDGSFVYAPANSRTDLFPLNGRYTTSGNTLSFTASRTVTFANSGKATAEIKGRVDLSSSELEMDSSSAAMSAAVVSNRPYGFTSPSVYKIRATLR